MAVHVVIKRKFKMNNPDELLPLLNEIRNRASEQPGYISSNTLQSMEDPEDYLVISVWQRDEDWKRWFLSEDRRDIQGKIDSLIGERTFYEMFHPLD